MIITMLAAVIPTPSVAQLDFLVATLFLMIAVILVASIVVAIRALYRWWHRWNVSTTTELDRAMRRAKPGDTIYLRSGFYDMTDISPR